MLDPNGWWTMEDHRIQKVSEDGGGGGGGGRGGEGMKEMGDINVFLASYTYSLS